MQEFSSVTASSYDAESLAPMLAEKAAEGWSVVGIISAGTNVVAYLTRGGSDAPASVDAAPIPAAAASSDGWAAECASDSAPQLPTDVADVAASDEAAMPAGGGDMADAALADNQFSDTSAPAALEQVAEVTPADIAPVAEPVAESAPVIDAGDATVALAGGVTQGDAAPVMDAVQATPEPVPGEAIAEHAGAPVVPEPVPEAPVLDQGTIEQPVVEPEAAPPVVEQAPAEPVVEQAPAEPVVEQAPAEPVVEEAPAEEPAAEAPAEEAAADESTDDESGDAGSGVPAGWYADPSGRYELRYWDGSAWTEHVSRAGQQYTDPPVA